MYIYLDIETIPDQSGIAREQIMEDAASERLSIKPPGNYKTQEAISGYVAAKIREIDEGIEEKCRKTALNGSYGQVVCAAMAVNDDPVKAFYSDDLEHGEASTLRNLFDAISSLSMRDMPIIVGHNIRDFDMRFLGQRAIIHGIKPPSCLRQESFSKGVFDTMTEWAGRGNRISMDKLCKILGLAGKGDMDGSKVWPAIQDGRIIEVVDYCMDDVERVRKIHKRMMFF